MQEYKLKVHSLESFGSVDGPGVRYVVFLQGCKMRCRYCHNPDTWTMDGGEEYSVDTLCEKVLKYRTYWGKDNSKGGVTVSGGEPLLQIKSLVEFMKMLKAKGVHTAIDTSGQPFSYDEDFMEDFSELIELVKPINCHVNLIPVNSVKERDYKKSSDNRIAEFIKILEKYGINVTVRRTLGSDINASCGQLRRGEGPK